MRTGYCSTSKPTIRRLTSASTTPPGLDLVDLELTDIDKLVTCGDDPTVPAPMQQAVPVSMASAPTQDDVTAGGHAAAEGEVSSSCAAALSGIGEDAWCR